MNHIILYGNVKDLYIMVELYVATLRMKVTIFLEALWELHTSVQSAAVMIASMTQLALPTPFGTFLPKNHHWTTQVGKIADSA